MGTFPISQWRPWLFSSYLVGLNGFQNGRHGTVSSRFAKICENLGSPISPEIGVGFMCLTIPPKLLHQIGRPLSHFVEPKRSLIAVFIGFSSRPNQKVEGENLFFHIEKGTFCFVLFRISHSIFDQKEPLLA